MHTNPDSADTNIKIAILKFPIISSRSQGSMGMNGIWPQTLFDIRKPFPACRPDP